VAFSVWRRGFRPWSMVTDGQPGARFWDVTAPVYSADGKHLAYVGATGMQQKWSMVVDGQTGTEGTGILGGVPAFGPDGSLEFLEVRGAGVIKDGELYRVKYTPAP
jgi:hypothetical protein